MTPVRDFLKKKRGLFPFKQTRRPVGEPPKWLLLPAILLLLVFYAIPVVVTFYFSFTDFSLTGTAVEQFTFVGWKHFVSMYRDPTFWRVVHNTLLFLAGSLLGQQVLGFFLALLLRGRSRLVRGLVGTIVVAAWVLPEVVVAFIWFAVLDVQGVLNWLLSIVDVPPIAWLYQHPMISVIVANIWHGTAFSMLMYQAALNDVPVEVEEAAMLDGASSWSRILHVILPMIRSSILTSMILVTLQTMGVFGLILALTGGGPGIATETLPLFMYHQAFVNFQLGYGTAISLVLLTISMVLSVGYARLLRSPS